MMIFSGCSPSEVNDLEQNKNIEKQDKELNSNGEEDVMIEKLEEDVMIEKPEEDALKTDWYTGSCTVSSDERTVITHEELIEFRLFRPNLTVEGALKEGFKLEETMSGIECTNEYVMYFFLEEGNTPYAMEIFDKSEFKAPRDIMIGDSFQDVLCLLPNENEWSIEEGGYIYGKENNFDLPPEHSASSYIDNNGNGNLSIMTNEGLPYVQLRFNSGYLDTIAYYYIYLNQRYIKETKRLMQCCQRFLDDIRVDVKMVTIFQEDEKIENYEDEIGSSYLLYFRKDTSSSETDWCRSELVWAGYKKQGIDIEKSGTSELGITPHDIKDCLQVFRNTQYT